MGPTVFYIIVIVPSYVHQNSAVLSKRLTLLGLVKYVTPHILGGTLSTLNFAPFNLVFDEEAPSLDVLGFLGGQEGPI